MVGEVRREVHPGSVTGGEGALGSAEGRRAHHVDAVVGGADRKLPERHGLVGPVEVVVIVLIGAEQDELILRGLAGQERRETADGGRGLDQGGPVGGFGAARRRGGNGVLREGVKASSTKRESVSSRLRRLERMAWRSAVSGWSSRTTSLPSLTATSPLLKKTFPGRARSSSAGEPGPPGRRGCSGAGGW